MTTITKAEVTSRGSESTSRPASYRLGGLKRRWAAIRAMFVWDTTASTDWQHGIHRRDRWT